MTDTIETYLARHSAHFDATVANVVRYLSDPDDSHKAASDLPIHAAAALRKALVSALASGPGRGWVHEVSGDVVLGIRRRSTGNLGKVQVSSARLSTGDGLPAPAEWPTTKLDQEDLPPVVRLVLAASEPQGTNPQKVVVDADGRVEVGADLAGRAYVARVHENGDVWLTPLVETPQRTTRRGRGQAAKQSPVERSS